MPNALERNVHSARFQLGRICHGLPDSTRPSRWRKFLPEKTYRKAHAFSARALGETREAEVRRDTAPQQWQPWPAEARGDDGGRPRPAKARDAMHGAARKSWRGAKAVWPVVPSRGELHPIAPLRRRGHDDRIRAAGDLHEPLRVDCALEAELRGRDPDQFTKLRILY